MLVDLLSWVLLLAGSLLVITGGIGLIRLPEFFTRLHAASIPDTMGAGLIVFGLTLQSGFSQASVKLILILVFLFFTGPTATHALAKAALHGKLRPKLDQQDPLEHEEEASA